MYHQNDRKYHNVLQQTPSISPESARQSFSRPTSYHCTVPATQYHRSERPAQALQSSRTLLLNSPESPHHLKRVQNQTPFGKFPTLLSAFSCSAFFALSTCEWTGRCYARVPASHRSDHQFEELSCSRSKNKIKRLGCLTAATKVGDVIQPPYRIAAGGYFACVVLASSRVKPCRLTHAPWLLGKSRTRLSSNRDRSYCESRLLAFYHHRYM